MRRIDRADHPDRGDRADIHAAYDDVEEDFAALVGSAGRAELRRRTAGTRWTNRELLFHMLFGYLLARLLVVLVRGLSRVPPVVSRRFAASLDALTRPFHVVNYLSALPGGRLLPRSAMVAMERRVIRSLHRLLEGLPESELRRAMSFPVGWDPYFEERMDVEQVLRWANAHYRHHRAQLTLGEALREV
ncbi:MAG: DinB family protein [Phycicoccus sp.]